MKYLEEYFRRIVGLANIIFDYEHGFLAPDRARRILEHTLKNIEELRYPLKYEMENELDEKKKK